MDYTLSKVFKVTSKRKGEAAEFYMTQRQFLNKDEQSSNMMVSSQIIAPSRCHTVTSFSFRGRSTMRPSVEGKGGLYLEFERGREWKLRMVSIINVEYGNQILVIHRQGKEDK